MRPGRRPRASRPAPFDALPLALPPVPSRTAEDAGEVTGPEAPAPDGLGTPGAPIPTGPPGAATFSLEGRAAPGLYFVGWLGTILGLALLLVALLSGGQIAGVVLALIGVVLLSVGLVSAAGAQALQRR